MHEFQEKAEILAMQALTADMYRCRLHAPQIAAAARPGQFVMVRVSQGLDPLLRRPLSIHRVDRVTVELLFKVVGRGTALLAAAAVGGRLDLVGPLGHGFSEDTSTPVLLEGGGMGIAPLLFLAARLRAAAPGQSLPVLLGARHRGELEVLAEDFVGVGCEVHVATDDGSLGHHGLVTELFSRVARPGARVAACGPWPMLRAVACQCREQGYACEVSLETMMACGLAACLGCAVPRPGGGYAHVCKDGPVFAAGEVVWG
ncbi:MAG: hypothetical protein BWK76_19460 [Desulfobulbaceae bacterium A2]|nr:MAG: hypothetical protein BWK76_19460 [Desulfobulbaceae bacterium A2]